MKRGMIAGLVLVYGISLAGAVEKPWELSLGGGWTVAQQETPGYAHSQDALWGSIGYHVAPAWSVGMEGGHLFGKDTAHADFEFTEHNSAIYIGPYVQGEIPLQRLSFYGRVGVGAATSSTHFQNDPDIGSGYFDTHETDMGMTLALGARVWLLSNVALGLGMRDVLLFQHELEFGDSGNFDDTLHGRHLLMPFGELLFRF
jgi:hypothetical protein